jgi:hypothetical protein
MTLDSNYGELKMERSLIQVWGDVWPILFGPYKTDRERLRKAKQLNKEDPGTLLRLSIDKNGKPFVCPFSAAELPLPKFR